MSDAAGMKPVFRMVSTHNTRIQVAGEDDQGGGQDDEDEKERRRRRIPAHRRLLRKSVTVDLLDREAHKLQSSDIIQVFPRTLAICGSPYDHRVDDLTR